MSFSGIYRPLVAPAEFGYGWASGLIVLGLVVVFVIARFRIRGGEAPALAYLTGKALVLMAIAGAAMLLAVVAFDR